VLGGDLNKGQIGSFIGADDFCFVLFFVRKADRDFCGLAYDMIVRNDIAVLTDEEA
jgi:hypothetical protein